MSTKIEVGLEDILLEALTNAKCKNEVDAKLCYDNAFPLVNKLAEFQSENAENPRKVSTLSLFYKQCMKLPISLCVAYSSTQWNVKNLTSLTKSHMCCL